MRDLKMRCLLEGWFLATRLAILCGGGNARPASSDQVVESRPTEETNGNVPKIDEEKAVSDSFEEEEIQQLLEQIARENGFQAPRYEVSAATKAGDNFLGRVLRAVILESGPRRKEKLSLIFKTAPASQARRDALRSGIIFSNEANMYQKVFPALNNFLKEYGLSKSDHYPNTPRCLAMKIGYDANENAEDVLVLEDLSDQGYAMLDKNTCLDVDGCRLVLSQLAVLHATSLAMRILRPEDSAAVEDTLMEAIFLPDTPMIPQIKLSVMKNLSYIEDRFPIGSPEYDKMKDLADNFVDIMCNAVAPNDELSCLNHGDLWMNNILFKQNKESGKIENACLIDFQICRVASPVLDVVHFLFTSTTKEFRDVHYHNLLKDYYDTLSSTLLNLGCDPEERVPWSLFQDHLKQYGRYGLGWYLFAAPLLLVDSSDIPDDMNNAKDEDDENLTELINSSDAGSKDRIKKRLSDLLQDTIEYGYL